MWNIKYDTNEHTYKTETNSQTQRTDLWLPRGRGEKEERIGINRCKLLYIHWMNNKVYGIGWGTISSTL